MSTHRRIALRRGPHQVEVNTWARDNHSLGAMMVESGAASISLDVSADQARSLAAQLLALADVLEAATDGAFTDSHEKGPAA